MGGKAPRNSCPNGGSKARGAHRGAGRPFPPLLPVWWALLAWTVREEQDLHSRGTLWVSSLIGGSAPRSPLRRVLLRSHSHGGRPHTCDAAEIRGKKHALVSSTLSKGTRAVNRQSPARPWLHLPGFPVSRLSVLQTPGRRLLARVTPTPAPRAHLEQQRACQWPRSRVGAPPFPTFSPPSRRQGVPALGVNALTQESPGGSGCLAGEDSFGISLLSELRLSSWPDFSAVEEERVLFVAVSSQHLIPNFFFLFLSPPQRCCFLEETS